MAETSVSLHLDARRPGVLVPAPFGSQAHLVLQYGWNMPVAIPDLQISDEGVSATLSFARNPHKTFVPWSAVYIVSCEDGRVVIYPEDVPEEVSQMMPRAGAPDERGAPAETTAELAETPERPTPTRRLRAIADDEAPPPAPRGDGEGDGDEDSEGPTADGKRRKRPQLRLVK